LTVSFWHSRTTAAKGVIFLAVGKALEGDVFCASRCAGCGRCSVPAWI